MFVVFEGNIGDFEFAATLHIDGPVRIDEDVGNGWVCEQRLKRSQPKKFVLNVINEPVTFCRGKGHRFLRQDAFCQA